MYGGPKSTGGWILHWFFRLCWTFISPLIILVVFIAYLYSLATSKITYSTWVDVSNYLILTTCFTEKRNKKYMVENWSTLIKNKTI